MFPKPRVRVTGGLPRADAAAPDEGRGKKCPGLSLLLALQSSEFLLLSRPHPTLLMSGLESQGSALEDTEQNTRGFWRNDQRADRTQTSPGYKSPLLTEYGQKHFAMLSHGLHDYAC